MSTLKVNAVRGTGASSDAITVHSTDGTCTANITNNLSNRNLIINGEFLCSQRNSGTSTSTGYQTVDRFAVASANLDQLAFTQGQNTDIPDGFSKSYNIQVTTAETALAVDELFYVRTKLEAQNLRRLYNADGTGKDFTLSFWVKAKQTGTYQVSIHKEDNTTRFITATYAISSADTWEKKSITFTGDTGTSGINVDNGQGFDISWKLAAGTNYTSGGAQTSWGGFGNTVFAGGQAVDITSSTANYWRITGIQLELGNGTDYEHSSYHDELLKCQRYYYQHISGDGQAVSNGFFWNAGELNFVIQFPVQMRATPSIEQVYGTDYFKATGNGYSDGISSYWRTQETYNQGYGHWIPADTNGTSGASCIIHSENAATRLAYNAEL